MRLLRGGHLRVRAPRGNSGPILASSDTNCYPYFWLCLLCLCMPNNCIICVWVLWVGCFSECRSQNKVLLRSFIIGLPLKKRIPFFVPSLIKKYITYGLKFWLYVKQAIAGNDVCYLIWWYLLYITRMTYVIPLPTCLNYNDCML